MTDTPCATAIRNLAAGKIAEATLPATCAVLGVPDAKLAYWDDVVESKDGQWVDPSRGLAVFTTLADTEVARVVAFPPTTVETYRARLARATEAPKEIEGP